LLLYFIKSLKNIFIEIIITFYQQYIYYIVIISHLIAELIFILLLLGRIKTRNNPGIIWRIFRQYFTEDMTNEGRRGFIYLFISL